MPPERIMIADDHSLVRLGFRSLLESMGYTVVGEAADGDEAVRLAQETKPDIVLMDITMPRLNGLEATRRLHDALPTSKTIILSMHATTHYARQALQAGAVGYLTKDSDYAEIKLALDAVTRGDVYLCSQISNHLVADLLSHTSGISDRLDKLTSRHREILQLIAEGYSRQEIAERLSISVKTYDTYRHQMMETLDIRNTAGLVRYAVSKGLVNSDR